MPVIALDAVGHGAASGERDPGGGLHAEQLVVEGHRHDALRVEAGRLPGKITDPEGDEAGRQPGLAADLLQDDQHPPIRRQKRVDRIEIRWSGQEMTGVATMDACSAGAKPLGGSAPGCTRIDGAHDTPICGQGGSLLAPSPNQHSTRPGLRWPIARCAKRK
ncbi:hypothetical protein [Methylobacterium aquaticum]|uniref:hypothetical protein n=1 Tax=Methylobacterium aquaticum TaxID=270351 RepID=UPI0019344C58|nr:hypothetical protein [Methylobacterium aquaticum]